MAEYVSYQNPQLVAPDQNVLLIDTIPCNKGYVIHRNGSGILTLRGITNGCARFARYQVTFNGNIAIPATGTAGAIATALAIDGEPLQSSRAIVTPAAVEQYFNVTNTAIITVPADCCTTLAVENVNAGVGEDIAIQAINVADGNLTVQRIA
jgi:hypothetical protein